MRWAVTAACALAAGSAFAFGTTNLGGQHAEHEKITRRALGCSQAGVSHCFQTDTLDQLAGRKGTFGAIGYPDSSYAVFQSKAHCDDGDFLPSPGYPHSLDDARAKLEECRAWMARNLAEAVSDADALVDGDGKVRRSQATLFGGCVWKFNLKGRAKCNVLQDLGIMMHAAQDFYAHTNWVDRGGGDSPEDPPGLGHSGRAPWIDLRRREPFPDGLMSGCYVIAGSGCSGRVTHAALNKDTGEIGDSVGPGTTPRGGGAVNNFKTAVEAAVDDTRDKWLLFQELLEAKYGAARAAQMVCALTHDDPADACRG